MVVRILKGMLKVLSFIKNYEETFYEGMRGYRYFRKRWETQLDEFNIEHTEKEVKQLAVQDFIKAKGKAVLLITLCIAVFFVCSSGISQANYFFDWAN